MDQHEQQQSAEKKKGGAYSVLPLVLLALATKGEISGCSDAERRKILVQQLNSFTGVVGKSLQVAMKQNEETGLLEFQGAINDIEESKDSVSKLSDAQLVAEMAEGEMECAQAKGNLIKSIESACRIQIAMTEIRERLMPEKIMEAAEKGENLALSLADTPETSDSQGVNNHPGIDVGQHVALEHVVNRAVGLTAHIDQLLTAGHDHAAKDAVFELQRSHLLLNERVQDILEQEGLAKEVYKSADVQRMEKFDNWNCGTLAGALFDSLNTLQSSADQNDEQCAEIRAILGHLGNRRRELERVFDMQSLDEHLAQNERAPMIAAAGFEAESMNVTGKQTSQTAETSRLDGQIADFAGFEDLEELGVRDGDVILRIPKIKNDFGPYNPQ